MAQQKARDERLQRPSSECSYDTLALSDSEDSEVSTDTASVARTSETSTLAMPTVEETIKGLEDLLKKSEPWADPKPEVDSLRQELEVISRRAWPQQPTVKLCPAYRAAELGKSAQLCSDGIACRLKHSLPPKSIKPRELENILRLDTRLAALVSQRTDVPTLNR